MKIKLMVLLIFIICTGIFAQDVIYVSARGSDENTGLTETAPLKTLSVAFARSVQNNISTITVIGKLDINSEGARPNSSSVFRLSINNPTEILITGKRNARGAERAILSAIGTSYSPISIESAKIRFEHIEISGGVGEMGVGLFVLNRAQVTLGEGAIVRDNNNFGVLVSNEGAVLTIDGGEVRNNRSTGVFLNGSVFFFNNGTITGNRAGLGAGVIVTGGARFEMSGGSVTRNSADNVGGVVVTDDSIFIQTGGTVRNNTARRNSSTADIWRQ
ncbi:MAG: hypothetical protein FWD24_04250 [Treponema sp.]|nr:hypothetical protein [Treponema sp.]